jgi:hypothetical protein
MDQDNVAQDKVLETSHHFQWAPGVPLESGFTTRESRTNNSRFGSRRIVQIRNVTAGNWSARKLAKETGLSRGTAAEILNAMLQIPLSKPRGL